MWLIALLFALAIDTAFSACSSFTYKVGSTTSTGYLLRVPGSGTITASGTSTITTTLGPRFYLTTQCQTAFGTGANIFSGYKLLGGSITFTVDLSQIGCGLNAAFYLVSMPSSTGPGSANDYYCDANCVGGNCCTEMDLLEANRHALQISPHRCTSATSGCDGGGCGINTQSITTGYGPGTQYIINTLSPFTVKITFSGSSSSLTGISAVVSQGSKSITLNPPCASDYLSTMAPYFSAGIVPVWSYWQGDMGWLDSPACTSNTPEVTGNFVFKDLAITGSVVTITGPPPPPPVAPGTLTCSTKGVSNNLYWVEFYPPSGVNGASTAATISCTTGSCQACTWFASGGKYQCSCPGSGCVNPTAKVGGKSCVFSATAALADETTTSTNQSTDPLVIGLSVGIAVMGILLVVVIVLLLKAKSPYIEKA